MVYENVSHMISVFRRDRVRAKVYLTIARRELAHRHLDPVHSERVSLPNGPKKRFVRLYIRDQPQDIVPLVRCSLVAT